MLHFKLEPGGFSVVIIFARPELRTWLEGVARRRSIPVERLYDPVMTGVWLIPRIGSLDEDLDAYLARLKPYIATRELGSYGEVPTDVAEAELFDRFFTLEVREDAFVAPGPSEI